MKSSVVRQKGESQYGVSKKQRTPSFPKNKQFLPHDAHTYVCVSGGKKCLFFGKFGVLCFLETSVLRFAHLPYNRRLGFKMEMLWFLVKCLDSLCIVLMPRRHNGVLRNKVKTPIYNSYFI